MTPARPRPRFIVSRFAEGEIVGVRIVGGGEEASASASSRINTDTLKRRRRGKIARARRHAVMLASTRLDTLSDIIAATQVRGRLGVAGGSWSSSLGSNADGTDAERESVEVNRV
jgi:hypothetical protein